MDPPLLKNIFVQKLSDQVKIVEFFHDKYF